MWLWEPRDIKSSMKLGRQGKRGKSSWEVLQERREPLYETRYKLYSETSSSGEVAMLLAPNGNAIFWTIRAVIRNIMASKPWHAARCTARNVVVAFRAADVLDVQRFEFRPRPVSGLKSANVVSDAGGLSEESNE